MRLLDASYRIKAARRIRNSRGTSVCTRRWRVTSDEWRATRWRGDEVTACRSTKDRSIIFTFPLAAIIASRTAIANVFPRRGSRSCCAIDPRRENSQPMEAAVEIVKRGSDSVGSLSWRETEKNRGQQCRAYRHRPGPTRGRPWRSAPWLESKRSRTGTRPMSRNARSSSHLPSRARYRASRWCRRWKVVPSRPVLSRTKVVCRTGRNVAGRERAEFVWLRAACGSRESLIGWLCLAG